jgi:hypothetical protein
MVDAPSAAGRVMNTATQCRSADGVLTERPDAVRLSVWVAFRHDDGSRVIASSRSRSLTEKVDWVSVS